MRWEFREFDTEDDATLRAEILQRIDAWWAAFESKAPEFDALFSGDAEWDLPAWMASNLSVLSPQLMWEFGPACDGDGHRLVITPEAERPLRPLTDEIVARAPNIPGWEFYGHRLPAPVDEALAALEARVGRTPSLSHVHVSPGADRLIDLVYFGADVAPETKDRDFEEAFVLTETLLGEETMNQWVGVIESKPLKKPGLLGIFSRKVAPPGIPLAELPQAVKFLIGEIHAGIPEPSLEEITESSTWNLLKLQPKEADDYVDQDDLFLARTFDVDFWEAARSRRFYDGRFGRHGELFCYLKVDDLDRPAEEKLDRRNVLEEALEGALRPYALGTILGGGTGLRYSYIDLALTDPVKALAAIRKALSDLGVSKRSWVIFRNPDRAGEWIGIHEDSPTPPGAPGN